MKFEELAKSFSQKKLPHSEIELSGEIPAATVAEYRTQALTHLAEHLELPGFRKGNVPHDVALKKIGEMAVLEEAVELMMRDFYPELIMLKKIDAVSRPDIRITKLAPGNPVAITIRTATYPKIELPKNWRALAEKIESEKPSETSDEEVTKTLESIRANRAFAAKEGTPGTEELPDINDEFARSIGAFADLADLTAKIKQGIGEEKLRAARDKRRGKIIDALLEKINVDMPRVFVESELEKILAQLKDDVARIGRPFEEYLKKIGKTEESLREEFRAQAEKRAKLQLTLNELAEQEKIKPDEKDVEEEMKHAVEHFPKAKPDLLRVHIQTVLRNEKVLTMLESAENA